MHDTSIAANDVLLQRAWCTGRVRMIGSTVLMGRGASLTAQIASPGAAAPGGTDLRPGATTAPTAATLPLKFADWQAGLGDPVERHPCAVIETAMGSCRGLRLQAHARGAAPRPTACTSDGEGQTTFAAAPAAPRPAGTITGPMPATARAALRSARGRASGMWGRRRAAHRAAARSRQLTVGIRRPRRARRTACPRIGRQKAGGGAWRGPASAAQSEWTRSPAAQAA